MWCSNCGNNAVARSGEVCLTCKTAEYDDEVCEECGGTGEVATDEDDGEGHLMRGVGTSKCICQISSTE
jgi:hypothetical protein